MGVRCTLFGHDYGDSEVEREREERGDEAVVTIREIEVCDRCGERTVVSESKEVTSVAEPEDGPVPSSEPDPTPVDAGVDEATNPEHEDPETDDGVILDDGDEPEPEPEGRQYGEWPDADEDHASANADPVAAGEDSAPREWPDAPGDDRGVDASTPAGEEDGVDSSELADAALSGGDADEPAADEPVAEDDDAELLDAGGASDAESASDDPADAGADAGVRREREAPSPTEPSTAGTALHCPNCGYRDDSTDGSLRGGDICPECKKGYLAARD